MNESGERLLPSRLRVRLDFRKVVTRRNREEGCEGRKIVVQILRRLEKQSSQLFELVVWLEVWA